MVLKDRRYANMSFVKMSMWNVVYLWPIGFSCERKHEAHRCASRGTASLRSHGPEFQTDCRFPRDYTNLDVRKHAGQAQGCARGLLRAG